MRRKVIHLLCGPSGAGKTTHAHRIALETQAVHLSIDECLKPLAFPDSPDMIYLQMALKKAATCADEILNRTKQLLAENKDVVLDIATFKRVQRDYIRDWANNLNAQVILYYISANSLTRRSRVLNRNEQKGKTHSFGVPSWLFDLMETMFEPPLEDEAAILIETD